MDGTKSLKGMETKISWIRQTPEQTPGEPSNAKASLVCLIPGRMIHELLDGLGVGMATVVRCMELQAASNTALYRVMLDLPDAIRIYSLEFATSRLRMVGQLVDNQTGWKQHVVVSASTLFVVPCESPVTEAVTYHKWHVLYRDAMKSRAYLLRSWGVDPTADLG